MVVSHFGGVGSIGEGTKEFWRRSRVGFLAFLSQRCSNKHGHFLVVVEHGGGRQRGHILVPDGRNGK
jgi:hypothetical protein